MTVTFHIGLGAATEQEVIEVARGMPNREMTSVIERAEPRGPYVWVLATETGQVIGTLDSRGGVALCVQDIEAAVP